MKQLRITWALLAALVACSHPARAQASPEYKLKAAYLFNFAKFVDWPSNTFAEATTPIVIGVLGEDPFGTVLEEIVQGRTINGRPLTIQRARRLEELKTCQLLFISRSEQQRLKNILTQLGERPVLTVSDADNFLDGGGTIRLLMEGRSVRFEISAVASERAGLKIDAQLLNLARAVRPVTPK